MKVALTIAGSDSSGGAGIQADLKTFAAHGVFGTSAITAVTAQNRREVTRVFALAPDMVAAQIDAVVSDMDVDATKIGMLANAAIANAVADAIARHSLRHVVLDPVMVATSGATLLDPEAIGVLRDRLMPLASLVTPNVAEAEALTGLRVATVADLGRAARRLVDLGARAALVKGGHLKGPAVDVLWDGSAEREFSAARVPGVQTHGTGCTLSAAIAAGLALGDDLAQAVERAKDYVTRILRECRSRDSR